MEQLGFSIDLLPQVAPPKREMARHPRQRASVSRGTIEALTFSEAVLDPEAHRRLTQQKPRRCLSCEIVFDSEGPGNRICQPCKQLVAWSASSVDAVLSGF
jgi:hypothetical protein